MQAAAWIVTIVSMYALTGLAFAIAFVTVGVQRIDAAARGAGLGFRLLLVPGAVALWPVLARRWLQ